ncbi:hypothetical protein BG004_007376 [Podila humilis]|nr:hypothetical protein BG004_007376 [Podila humilis]
MKRISEAKNSNSFEMVSIDDSVHSPTTPDALLPSQRQRQSQGCFYLSPRARLVALALYLMTSGMSSLYFCLVQAGLERLEICESITGCLLYSAQGWPALGEQSIDLVVMSFISGSISVTGGILGTFGIYAAYKESSSKVRLFAKVWWIMIGVFIGSTVMTLFLTVVHKARFLDQCTIEHDTVLGTSECGAMYYAALVGSVVGCLIGVTMIWCYGDDVVRNSAPMSLDNVTTVAKRTAAAEQSSTALVSRIGRNQPEYKSNIPAPPPQQILEEDDYTEALSKIIERDFFPDIAKLKRQHEYLDALAMNDAQRIQAAARDLAGNDTPLTQRRLRTPAQTPRLGSGLPNEAWTPARVDIGNATPTWQDEDRKSSSSSVLPEDTPILDTPTGVTLKKMRKASSDAEQEEPVDAIDTTLSLDQFQSRYTSEDNASFNEILEKMNMRKKEKYHWMYDQEKKTMRLIEPASNPDMKLLRQSGEEQGGASAATANGDDVIATGEGSAALQLALTDKRDGTITTWGYKAKNSLMYFPDGVGTTLDSNARGNPKEIIHSNTNFQDRDLLVLNPTAASKIEAEPSVHNTYSRTMFAVCYITLDLKGQVSDTPRVNGYGFVSSTPTPSMSQMENDPEMMTWGTIEDEPLLISSGITSTPSPFKLPPTPRRELIAQKLAEKASKSFRDNSTLRAQVFSSPSASALSKYQSAISGGNTPTPRFEYPYPSTTPLRKDSRAKYDPMPSPSPRARASMLSPAAQSLLSRANSGRSRGADYQLRSSYGNNDRGGSSTGRLGSVTPSPLTARRK